MKPNVAICVETLDKHILMPVSVCIKPNVTICIEPPDK